MNCFFVVNNIALSKIEIRATDIVDKLLAQKRWIFLSTTPYIGKLKENDNILIYIAGKDNRYFYGRFHISGPLQGNNLVPENEIEKELYGLFNLSCLIKNIEVFPKKISIYDLKDDLNFITDKKNWGLFFRQSAKQIDQVDYELILNKAHGR